MVKNIYGNDLTEFAKLSYVSRCAAIDGNASVVALNLEADFFAVAKYWR